MGYCSWICCLGNCHVTQRSAVGISILRWAILTGLWTGFCHTGPISLCVDLFVFICVYAILTLLTATRPLNTFFSCLFWVLLWYWCVPLIMSSYFPCYDIPSLLLFFFPLLLMIHLRFCKSNLYPQCSHFVNLFFVSIQKFCYVCRELIWFRSC